MEVGVTVLVTLWSSAPSSADCRGCLLAKPDGCVRSKMLAGCEMLT